jgi:hypothetical protein
VVFVKVEGQTTGEEWREVRPVGRSVGLMGDVVLALVGLGYSV